MASATKPISFSLPPALLFLLLITFPLSHSSSSSSSASKHPIPSPWPPQFHSVLFMNRSGTLQKVDLWYDWPKGRNFNIIQTQLGKLTYDLEWNNGTSFVFTSGADGDSCRVLHFDVGILRPNWLDGANYLGRRYFDGFLCNVWEKADFIWYYEDVDSKRPVFWAFYTGFTGHVMTFEVGKVLEDAKWQAPVYCFKEAEEEKGSQIESMAPLTLTLASNGGLMRDAMAITTSMQL